MKLFYLVRQSNDIEEMLRQREPFYMKANHIFDVSLLNSAQRVAESVRLLRKAIGI